jgi:hypothetical protein
MSDDELPLGEAQRQHIIRLEAEIVQLRQQLLEATNRFQNCERELDQCIAQYNSLRRRNDASVDSPPDVSVLNLSPIAGTPPPVERMLVFGENRIIDSPSVQDPPPNADPLWSPAPRQAPMFQGNDCYLGLCFPDALDAIINLENFTDARDIVFFFEFNADGTFANRVHCIHKRYYKQLVSEQDYIFVDWIRNNSNFPLIPFGEVDNNGLVDNPFYDQQMNALRASPQYTDLPDLRQERVYLNAEPEAQQAMEAAARRILEQRVARNYGALEPDPALSRAYLQATLAGRKLLMYQDSTRNPPHFIELSDVRSKLPMFKITSFGDASKLWRIGNFDGSYAESKQHGQIPGDEVFLMEEIPLNMVKDFLQDLVGEYVVDGQPRINEECIRQTNIDTQPSQLSDSPLF